MFGLGLSYAELYRLEVQQIMIERGYKHFPIIFLSGHGDIEMAVNAMAKGAVTFLEKSGRPERLNAEVEKAVELGFSRSRRAKERSELKRRYNYLTAREKEVLHLVVDGLTNKEIGDKLGLSLATVKMHRGHASDKLELSSVAEITRALIFNSGRGSAGCVGEICSVSALRWRLAR